MTTEPAGGPPVGAARAPPPPGGARGSARPVSPTEPRRVAAPPRQQRSPTALCAGPSGAPLVRGTLLRIPAVRFRSANIRVAVGRPTLRRRVVPTPTPEPHHPAWPSPPRFLPARRRQRRTSSLRCGRSTLTPPTRRGARQLRRTGHTKTAAHDLLDRPFHISAVTTNVHRCEE